MTNRAVPQATASYYALGKSYFFMRSLERSVAAHRFALALPDHPLVPRAYVHNDIGNTINELSGRQAEVPRYASPSRRMTLPY